MKCHTHVRFSIFVNFRPMFTMFASQDVKLTGFPEDSKLGQDLKQFASKHNREVTVFSIQFYALNFSLIYCVQTKETVCLHGFLTKLDSNQLQRLARKFDKFRYFPERTTKDLIRMYRLVCTFVICKP